MNLLVLVLNLNYCFQLSVDLGFLVDMSSGARCFDLVYVSSLILTDDDTLLEQIPR